MTTDDYVMPRPCFHTGSRHFSRSCQCHDHYKALGLIRSASKAQIKSHYYKLSKLHHPDVSNDETSKEIFRVASEAYRVLGNDRARRAYDRALTKSLAHDDLHTPHEARRRPGATHAWPGARQRTSPQRYPSSSHHSRPHYRSSTSSPGSYNVHQRHAQSPSQMKASQELDTIRGVSGVTRALQVIGLFCIATIVVSPWVGVMR